MQIRVMVLLLFSLVIAIFAVMNTQPVSINFFFTEAEIELIFVIIFSVLFGALFMFILSSMKQFQQSRKIRSLEKENIKLKSDLEQVITKQTRIVEENNENNNSDINNEVNNIINSVEKDN